MVAISRSLVLAVACLACVSGAAIADNAKFGCDMDAGACHFRILARGGGSTNVTLQAGQREVITNVSVAKDTYCVCIDTPVPANWCAAGGHSCMGYVPIGGGYNNETGTSPVIPKGTAEALD